MPWRRLRIITFGTALLAGGLVLASCGGGDEAGTTTGTETSTSQATETTTTTQEATTTEAKQPVPVNVVVVGGVPKGGIVRETVRKGDRVVLVVKSDEADEVHLHGYDISRDVEAGSTVRIAFVAKIPGRFEVELENRGVQIADLTVGS